jgi:hypothetical protein
MLNGYGSPSDTYLLRGAMRDGADPPRGEFTVMIKADLPFGDRTAQRLMMVAQHPVLLNPTHVSVLPPHWGTLAELARLPPPQVEWARRPAFEMNGYRRSPPIAPLGAARHDVSALTPIKTAPK